MARANAPNRPLPVRDACWLSATAHRLTSSLNRTCNNTSYTARILTDSLQAPCASATAPSDASPTNVLGRDWKTLDLIRAASEHRLPALLSLEEVRRLLNAAPPCPITSPSPPSPAVGCACTQLCPCR